MEDLKIFPLIHSSKEDQPWELMRDPRQWLKPDVVVSKIMEYRTDGRINKADYVYRNPGGDDFTIACEKWEYVDDPDSGLFMTRSSELVYMKNDDTQTDPIQLTYDQNDPTSEDMRVLSSEEKRRGRIHILSDVKILSMSALANVYPEETTIQIIGRGGDFWKHLGEDFAQYVETGAFDIVSSIQNEDPAGPYSWLDAASGFPGLTIRQFMIARIQYQ